MARRKKTTEEQPAPISNADENFGLPEIDYKPLNRDAASATEHTPIQESVAESVSEPAYVVSETTETRQESTYSTDYAATTEEASASSIAPKIIAIVVVLVLAIGAAWYFGYYKPQKDAEAKELADKKIKEEEAKEAARLAEQQQLEEERRKAAELAAANAQPKEGAIETLTGRTQRYYVVAASSIDADLVMDYAKKLSSKGVSSKIIPPYGKVKFSRLTVAEGETYADTQKLADGMKGEYGDKLWVIKY
jgi:hypothetical protein